MKEIMPPGTRVIISGDKHANPCFYLGVKGLTGTIGKDGARKRTNPYRLKGPHTFYYIYTDDGEGWEIHEDDLTPLNINNKEMAKFLLKKEW